MIPLGLTAAQNRTLHNTLFGHHQIRVRVQSTDLSGRPDADLTDYVTDGQVNVDYSAEVTRTATVTLLDLNRSIDFDSDSPSEAALYLDRMLRIWYDVWVNFADEPRWVAIPVFTGPITTLTRSGDTIDVEAQGKESLGMGAVWQPLTIPKNTRKVEAIRIILRERAGENLFGLPALNARLPKPYSLNRENVPWTAARNLATSLGGRQLFYDGRGRVRLRRLPWRPVLAFTADTMLSQLQVNYTQDQTINCVFVKGGVPSGKKKQLTAEVFPQRNHPLSPWRLGRVNSQGELVPRYLMEVVEDSTVRTLDAARRLGTQHLRQGLAQAVDASFDALPVPTLEPGDMVRAVTDQGSVTFAVRSYSLPLTAGSAMSVGYLKNVSPKRRGARTGGLQVRAVRAA